MSIPVHWKCEIHGHLGMFGWLEKRFLLSVDWETGPCTKLSNDHYLQLLPIIPTKILLQLLTVIFPVQRIYFIFLRNNSVHPGIL